MNLEPVNLRELSFESPANNLEFFIESIPRATRDYLSEHGMLHFSFDELEARWQSRREFTPAIREHSSFFDGLPAMRKAAEFYRGRKETQNEEVIRKGYILGAAFVGFLEERGWSRLSFEDLLNRYTHFSPFDMELRSWESSFEIIRRIKLLKLLDRSPHNKPTSGILENLTWDMDPWMPAQIDTELHRLGWRNIFDTFAIFGFSPHENDLQRYPALLPHKEVIEKFFDCAVESFAQTIMDIEDGYADDWLDPRIADAMRSQHKEEVSSWWVICMTTAIMSLMVLVLLGVLDYTSGHPRIIRSDLPHDISVLIERYYESIRGIFRE
jgi:hypothetical protein